MKYIENYFMELPEEDLIKAFDEYDDWFYAHFRIT